MTDELTKEPPMSDASDASGPRPLEGEVLRWPDSRVPRIWYAADDFGRVFKWDPLVADRWGTPSSHQFAVRRLVAEIAALREESERQRAEFEAIEHEVALVYDHITGGRCTKPNTIAVQVIAEADEHYQRYADEQEKDARDEERGANAALRQALLSVKRGTDKGQPCWCEHFGEPYSTATGMIHGPICEAAREALATGNDAAPAGAREGE